MLRDGAQLDEVMETIAETLPVCRVRELAYSTIALLQLRTDGQGYLAEFDSPDAIVLLNSHLVLPRKTERVVGNIRIVESRFSVNRDDSVLLITDGVVHAGVGNRLNMGWQWDNVAGYVRNLHQRGLGLCEIASGLINTCAHLYDSRPGDDCTVVAIKAIEPMYLTLLTGPPTDPARDSAIAREFIESRGKKVICGGSTAQMVARECQLVLHTAIKAMDSGVPPVAEMEGVDLVTEGVLTLAAALSIIRSFATCEDGQADSRLLRRADGASRLAALLMNHSTHVRLMVGQAVNEAHRQDEEAFEGRLRNQLTADLTHYLRLLGKEVTVEAC
jgi:hypothetical protein